MQLLLPKTAAVIPQNSFINRILERVKHLLNGSRTGVIMHYLAYFEEYWIFQFPSYIGFIVVYVKERFVVWKVLLSRESP